MLKHFALAVLATACLTACGSGTSPAAPVETVTATVQVTPAATPTVTSSPAETDPPKQEETTSDAAETKKLPSVVGMNLQEGQDKLQAAGFYVLNDKDATGQNRLQVFDRNWVVTDQKPAAGQRMSTDTLITLYAKKIGE